MALNSELDDLLEDLGVDDGPSKPEKEKTSVSAGGSPLNRWRIKTRGLIKKARTKRRAPDSDSDEDTTPVRTSKSDPSSNNVRNVLGGGFSIKKVTGWSSPSRTNKTDLRKVVEVIEATIRATRAELRTEQVMKAVSQELGQMFNARTWTEWFNIKIDEAYEKRDAVNVSEQEKRQSGITRSATSGLGRQRRAFDDDDVTDSDEDDDDDSEEDSPIRRRSAPTPHQSPGGTTRRQIIEDDDTDSQEELASAPFSEFRIGVFCTVLPTADATSVSREVRKQRRIKTQIWGPMQEKYGEHTGRIIMINDQEELVKLQFPEADLWFVYEALDLTESPKLIQAARAALRAANAHTPEHAAPRKPNFASAAANLAQKSLQRQQEQAAMNDPDADSDDDMRQHFQETTEQIEEVTVEFRSGPLGMGFGWDGEYLEVFKFNLDSSGNKGQAELSESIMVGDLLVAVNDRPLSGLTKSEVIDILKTTPRPMACTFRGIPAQ